MVTLQGFVLPYLISTLTSSQNTSTHASSFMPVKSTTSVNAAIVRSATPSVVEGEAVDAIFNGMPLTRKNWAEGFPTGHVHCVGENFHEYNKEDRHSASAAWMQRTCHFRQLCFDTSKQDYILFRADDERELSRHLVPNVYSSTTMIRKRSRDNEEIPQSVSLGGVNQKWAHVGIPRLQWFPRILNVAPNETATFSPYYYQMPESVVLIPYHSLNGANPGHLVWDDFLPIYTALDMFQLLDDAHGMFPMRHVLQDGARGLWASCDVRSSKTAECQHMINKFLPLMVGINYPYNATSTQDFVLQERWYDPAQSNRLVRESWTTVVNGTTRTESHDGASKNEEKPPVLICAKHAVAGIGSLTDHGVFKSHGWEEADYSTTHNHGRGASLYRFRNFMMRNLNLPVESLSQVRQSAAAAGRLPPHRIVFSQFSSDIVGRSLDFTRQVQLVRAAFPSNYVQVESKVLKEMTLRDQLELARTTSIFVSICGGSAVTSMFLPQGAAVILYYHETGGAEKNRLTGKPALLDWDLMNAMSYLRLHWFPRQSRKSKNDEIALIELIQYELRQIDEQMLDS
jgi:hypothetical protein